MNIKNNENAKRTRGKYVQRAWMGASDHSSVAVEIRIARNTNGTKRRTEKVLIKARKLSKVKSRRREYENKVNKKWERIGVE